jgi:hypothetical protein
VAQTPAAQTPAAWTQPAHVPPAGAPIRLTPIRLAPPTGLPQTRPAASPARFTEPAHPAEPAHPPAAHAAAHPAPRPPNIPVHAYQLRTAARLSLWLGRLPEPSLQSAANGVALHWDTPVNPEIARLPHLKQITGLATAADPAGGTTLVIAFTCDCTVQAHRSGGSFLLEITGTPAPATAAGKTASQRSELEALRDSLTARLALLNGPMPNQPAAPGAVPAGAAPPQAPGNLQPADPPGAAAAAAPPAPPAPRPACAPPFSLQGWAGEGRFVANLRRLRAKLAEDNDAPADTAALAELYLGNGLAAEALALVPPDATGPDAPRLARDADIARLLLGRGIASASPLLTPLPTCDRTDLPLWRALAAAAARDAEGVARDADAAGTAVQALPEPLLQMVAERLADAAPASLPTQKAMAAAMRNADIGGAEEAAGRYLLQARLARAAGSLGDETAFLQHAAQYPATLAAMTATSRLAELQSATDNAAGDHAALMLADTARVYRDTLFGQSAAAVLAERRLRHGDFAGALQVADDSAGPLALRQTDSRGASLAAHILRRLLVQPDAAGLPPPADRLVLYWRYQGYATPGERGDDIRMAAARLMLDQHMPEAALDATRQLADATLATPAGALLRATAEALGGDPAAALTRLAALPPGDEVNRIAAEALARSGHPAQAAHRLDGLAADTDQLRRAALLGVAKAWPEAAAGYAAVLQDPHLSAVRRADATEQYALALALAGDPAPAPVADADGLAKRVLGALPDASPAADPVPALRRALQRAAAIQTLLPPVAAAKSGS